MDVRVGTFNLNNLFDRFNFEADLGELPAEDRNVQTTYQWVFVGRGTGPDDPPPQLDAPSSSTPIVRVQKGARGELIDAKPAAAQQALATRIAAVDADVLALQEVENLDALRRFNRDLLALHVLTVSRRRRLLTLFVTHLKSRFVPFDDPDPEATAVANDQLRTRQAETIARVVAARTRPDTRYAILGDLNDAPDAVTLAPMVAALGLADGLADVVESRPPPPATPGNSPTDPRWTHRHSIANAPDSFELFDQVWLSPALAGRVSHAEIERRRA